MAVEIEREAEWALGPLVFVFLAVACFAAVVLRRHSAAAAGDLGPSTPVSLRFHRGFLVVFSMCAMMGGIQSVFGENEFLQCGLSREQMASRLAAGAAVALFLGSFSGIISDIIGPQKICTLYCILHLLVGVLKSLSLSPCAGISSILTAIASSIFSFSFETWMVMEQDKQGRKQELLYEMFWLMTYFESASLVGSQGLANFVSNYDFKGIVLPNALVVLLAILSLLYTRRRPLGSQHSLSLGSYRKSFSAHVLRDRRVLVLLWAQASVYFSISVFWLLWAPIMVADGRDVKLSQMYACFIGSRMLGSALFPWFCQTEPSLHVEDLLTASFTAAGFVLTIVAYDYQEIEMLVILFCIFHVAVGFILPSLARLRTLYLPNELRGGMMSVSLAPANVGLFIALVAGAYNRAVTNSAIMAISACSLFVAGGCIYILRRWAKQPHLNKHSL